MSNYNKIVTTLSGSNMLVESINQKMPLIFTRVALGDGTLSDNESIDLLTDLKHKICDNGIESVKKKGNGEIDVVATISNANVSTGFYARELGVYAKVGENGTEKLFAYTNAGSQASYTTAGTSLDEKLITITFYVGNAENVTINLNSQLYVTKDMVDGVKHSLESQLNAHKSDPNAHNLSRYAGGTPIPTGISDWNALTTPGIYEGNARNFGWANAPSSSKIYPYGQIQVTKTEGNIINQTFYSYGQGKDIKIATRTFYNAWSSWQYLADWDCLITEVTKSTTGINVKKGDGSPTFLQLLTTNKSDSNTNLAPTLGVVKELIAGVNSSISGVNSSISNGDVTITKTTQGFNVNKGGNSTPINLLTTDSSDSNSGLAPTLSVVKSLVGGVESSVRTLRSDVTNKEVTVTKNNTGINVRKGSSSSDIQLLTTNKSDSNTALAPTLAVVKSLVGDIESTVNSVRSDVNTKEVTVTKNTTGLTVRKGSTTSDLQLLTTNKAETNTGLAPTLAVVKSLIGDVESSVNSVRSDVNAKEVTVTKNNTGLTVRKGNSSSDLQLLTTNKSDSNTGLAPTLAVVKALIGDINLDVTSLLKSKGVRYDFSNENAWYICFGEAFGGLIIQGGKANVEVSSRIFADFINFPITFTRTPIVSATNVAETLDRDEWATSAISAISLTKFKYQSAQNGVTKLHWIAIGS